MVRMNPDNPGWLNDECIDAYFWLVMERGVRRCELYPKLKPIYFYTSHFMSTLLSGDVKIHRFSRKISAYLGMFKHGMSIFDLGKLGCPINRDDNRHWALAIIDFEAKEFQYYDSMHNKGKLGTEAYLKPLREYLLNELSVFENDKSRSADWIAETKVSPQYFMGRFVILIGADCTALSQEDIMTWTMVEMIGPLQENYLDCGVFCCQTGNYLALGRCPSYQQSDIKVLRSLMVDHFMGVPLMIDGSDLP